MPETCSDCVTLNGRCDALFEMVASSLASMNIVTEAVLGQLDTGKALDFGAKGRQEGMDDLMSYLSQVGCRLPREAAELRLQETIDNI